MACKAKLPGVLVRTGRSSGVLVCTNNFDWRKVEKEYCLYPFTWHTLFLFK